MKKLIVSFFCLFVFINAYSQKGWSYDKYQGFNLKDTSYFKENRIYNLTIQSQGEVLAHAAFNTVFKLDSIFSRDTLWRFTYDSIGRRTSAVSKVGDWPIKPKHYCGDSIFYSYFGDSTLIVTKKYFFGSSLTIHYDSLNKKYHKAEYVNTKTGNVDKPLPKKLKTKYEPNQVYVVKTTLQTKFYSRKKETKTKVKYPLKRGYFEKPEYLIANQQDIIESRKTNRLYHQKVFFDDSGRIKKFVFTDAPSSVYTVTYNTHIQ